MEGASEHFVQSDEAVASGVDLEARISEGSKKGREEKRIQSKLHALSKHVDMYVYTRCLKHIKERRTISIAPRSYSQNCHAVVYDEHTGPAYRWV
jgi:hypothetical protein